MKKLEALQLLGLSGHVTKEDIKRAYQRKAKEFHPDRNPAGADIMKLINVAYNMVRDEAYCDVQDDGNLSDYPDVLASAINAIASLALTIEVCGLWVWVSGDTKPHRHVLKEAGYLWSPRKKLWYFRPPQAKARKYWCKDKTEWTMDEIRQKYGASRPYGQDKRSAHRLANA